MIDIEQMVKEENVKIDDYALKLLNEVIQEIVSRIVGLAIIKAKEREKGKNEIEVTVDDVRKAFEEFYKGSKGKENQ